MDEAPAAVDRRVVEQPLQRPLAAPGDAFIDFAGLFGDMDMNRTDPARLTTASSSAGVTARSECGATPTIAPCCPATARRLASQQPRKTVDDR